MCDKTEHCYILSCSRILLHTLTGVIFFLTMFSCSVRSQLFCLIRTGTYIYSQNRQLSQVSPKSRGTLDLSIYTSVLTRTVKSQIHVYAHPWIWNFTKVEEVWRNLFIYGSSFIQNKHD